MLLKKFPIPNPPFSNSLSQRDNFLPKLQVFKFYNTRENQDFRPNYPNEDGCSSPLVSGSHVTQSLLNTEKSRHM